MDQAQYQEYRAELGRKGLEGCPRGAHGAVDPHEERHESEVEQIESDDQQPVHRDGQRLVAAEHRE